MNCHQNRFVIVRKGLLLLYGTADVSSQVKTRTKCLVSMLALLSRLLYHKPPFSLCGEISGVFILLFSNFQSDKQFPLTKLACLACI